MPMKTNNMRKKNSTTITNSHQTKKLSRSYLLFLQIQFHQKKKKKRKTNFPTTLSKNKETLKEKITKIEIVFKKTYPSRI